MQGKKRKDEKGKKRIDEKGKTKRESVTMNPLPFLLSSPSLFSFTAISSIHAVRSSHRRSFGQNALSWFCVIKALWKSSNAFPYPIWLAWASAEESRVSSTEFRAVSSSCFTSAHHTWADATPDLASVNSTVCYCKQGCSKERSRGAVYESFPTIPPGHKSLPTNPSPLSANTV